MYFSGKTDKSLIKHISGYIPIGAVCECSLMKTPTAFIKQNKPSAWKCSCGCVIPKKGAKLSGGLQYKQGYHVHCHIVEEP